MTGEQRIEAPRATVWAALNDAETLKACIPGCQSLEKVDDTHLRATVVVKVGPITARFSGEVTLSDLDPPNGYRIDGEGQGGAAGFAKGGAAVRLRDDGAATVLDYEVDAQVGGKLSQLGGALIDLTAKQMAGAFFSRLAAALAPPVAVETPSAEIPAAAEPAAPSPAPVRPAPIGRPASATNLSGAQLSLAAVAAALAGLLVGWNAGRAGGGWTWIAEALVLALVAWAAYSLGRNAPKPGAPHLVVLDPGELARLVAKSESA
jgi:carbon monoxide dehydrogenase subunit G